MSFALADQKVSDKYTNWPEFLHNLKIVKKKVDLNLKKNFFKLNDQERESLYLPL